MTQKKNWTTKTRSQHVEDAEHNDNEEEDRVRTVKDARHNNNEEELDDKDEIKTL